MIEHQDHQRLLDRFANWLREINLEIDCLEPVEPASSEFADPPADFGLLNLVEEFTALRHELKLQTKSARSLEEQVETLTTPLRQAIDALRSVEPKEAQAAWLAGKPLAMALAELDEALERGRLQTEKTVARLVDAPEHGVLARLDEFQSRASWLSRLIHGRYFEKLRQAIAEERQQADRSALPTALLEGYRLIQKRLAQALAAEGIARIDAVGELVDPERMVVVEVVETPDSPSGLVYDEVRRGYTWKGRLLRCAEVRATRRGPAPLGAGEEE